MASSDDPNAPRSTRSRILWWGGSILGGLLVLLLAAALLIPQLFTSEELKGYVIPPMEEATGRTVEIDEIRLRVLWTPAVSVSGFRLADREGYGPEPAVSAEGLDVEVALWPLLGAAIEPTAVELVAPTIRYEVAEDGTANFDDLLASDSTEAEEETSLSVPVSDFRTTGARVRYVDRSTGQSLALDFDARLRAILDGEAVSSDGTIEIQSLRAVLPDVQADTLTVTDAQVDYDAAADLGTGRLNLSDLTVETPPLTLSTTGTVSRLATRPTLDLTVETTEADLAQLAAFVPAASRQLSGLNPAGTIELSAAVQGPLPDSSGAMDSLSVDGTGRLAGVGLDYKGTALLRDLGGDLALSLDEAALRSVDGQLLGADLAGSVAVSDPTGTPQVAVDVETGPMNLADLAAFAPPEQVEGTNPQGTLRLDASVEGPLPEGTSSLDELAIDGTGQLAGVGVDYDGTAMLRDLGADLAFSGTSAAVQGIEGQLLGERLEGNVTVRDPLGDATVEGRLAGAADLSELSALAAAEGEEASAIAGTAEYDVQFAGPLDDPDALRPTGQVRLADVQYPYASFRHPLEVPDATVQLTGTGLSMDRFVIRSGEQEMALETTVRDLFPVSKGLAETDPAMTADVTFTADRLDLVALYPESTRDTSEVYYSQLFAATLSGSEVNGRSPEAIAKKLYGGTELPAYDVDGRVEIGTFLNDPQRIDDLGLDVQLRDRRLTVQNLSGATYDGELAGSITLNQRESAATSARRGPNASVLIAARENGAVPRATAAQSLASDLSYDVQLEGARAGAFLEDWTTLGRIVQGTLDLRIDGSTPLTEGFLPLAEALTAEGTSIVADGGLSLDLGVTKAIVERLGLGSSTLTKFRRFGGPFTIEDGRFEMGTWTLGGATEAEVTGALGLGGNVDVEMRMDLPMSALQGSNIPGLVGEGDGGLAGVVQKLTGAGRGHATIPVRLRIGGTIREPTVEIADKDAVRSRIQTLVKEEGLGRLRNLLPGGGGDR